MDKSQALGIAIVVLLILIVIGIIIAFYLTPKTYPLKGYFYADDELKVLLNDEEVYISDKVWDKKHEVQIEKVAPGDKITFRVTNKGGPGAFTGFFDWNNQRYTINKDTFPDTVVPSSVTPWATIDLSEFPVEAQWIWTLDNCALCTNHLNWIAPK